MPLQPKQEPPYYETNEAKSYRALLTQTGTNAPTATENQNNTLNITWSYVDVGAYNLTCDETLPTNTRITVGLSQFTGGVVIATARLGPTTFQLISYNAAAFLAAANGIINTMPITIQTN